jgi:hypothetical protein
MSERFKVTKSEDPNTFPNYGATTGMDADDNHGKMRTETDEKHPPSSLEETIGRKEQKYVHFSHFPQAFAIFTMSVVFACNAFVGPFVLAIYGIANAFLLLQAFRSLLFFICPASLNL